MEKEVKTNFFKEVWNSITKTEKYPELAAKGMPKAIKYLMELILLFAIVVNIGNIYGIHEEVNVISKYIEKEIPNFTYTQGILNVDTKEVEIKEVDEFGKVIMATSEQDEVKINEYINMLAEQNNGIVFLKDKVVVKIQTMSATINYNYSDLFKGTNITEFTKAQFLEYLNGKEMINMYLSIFLLLVISTFTIYLINTLINILAISLFGYIVSIIVKMRMKYKAIFNMTVYAITLPTILSMLYVLINYFTGFVIQFFDAMYVAVASIYLITAILIIKSDFIKKQSELIKIVEVQKTTNVNEEVEKELEENNDENKKEEKEDKKDQDKENKEQNEKELEGYNA